MRQVFRLVKVARAQDKLALHDAALPRREHDRLAEGNKRVDESLFVVKEAQVVAHPNGIGSTVAKDGGKATGYLKSAI